MTTKFQKKGAQVNKRRGYVLEHEIMRGMELVDGLTPYKIPDALTMGVMTRCKVPADFIVGVKGRGVITIEAKTTKLDAIPWANFKEHQITWSLEYPTSAFFIINFNNRKTGVKKINRTFIVNGYGIAKLHSKYTRVVPPEALKEVGIELERKTGKHHPDGTSAFIELNRELFK